MQDMYSLDTREGKLYRDADVIDSWNLQFFLTSPQHTRKIRSMSWNTGGVPTKLEKADVQQMLHDYDIICIKLKQLCQCLSQVMRRVRVKKLVLQSEWNSCMY